MTRAELAGIAIGLGGEPQYGKPLFARPRDERAFADEVRVRAWE